MVTGTNHMMGESHEILRNGKQASRGKIHPTWRKYLDKHTHVTGPMLQRGLERKGRILC